MSRRHYTNPEVLAAVMESDSLPWAAKQVYAALALDAKGEDQCKRAYITIAKKTGLDQGIVIVAIRSLVAYGLIRVERTDRANIYHFLEVPEAFIRTSKPPVPMIAQQTVRQNVTFRVRSAPIVVKTI